MEDKPQYTKLSALVNDTFTVESVAEFCYKKWSPEEKKMLTSMDWQEGFRKVYPVETDKGKLDLGTGQLSSLLEAAHYGGKSDIIDKTFKVKSNGKSGLDIRYYFSVQKAQNTGYKINASEETGTSNPEEMPY